MNSTTHVPRPKLPSPEYLEFEHAFVEAHPDVQTGQLFGMRALKVAQRTFLGGFAGGLVVKLASEDAARAENVDGAIPFDPSGRGRPMRAWVGLPVSSRDSWSVYAQLAYRTAREESN